MGSGFFAIEANPLRCRNKFGMTLRKADNLDQKVILNLFQDLSEPKTRFHVTKDPDLHRDDWHGTSKQRHPMIKESSRTCFGICQHTLNFSLYYSLLPSTASCTGSGFRCAGFGVLSRMFAKAPLPEQPTGVSKGAPSAMGCRNKFGMTLRKADYLDQKVILNLFQDLLEYQNQLKIYLKRSRYSSG
jgi:hypothetical protein